LSSAGQAFMVLRHRLHEFSRMLILQEGAEGAERKTWG
jgi:hypothetical protein